MNYDFIVNKEKPLTIDFIPDNLIKVTGPEIPKIDSGYKTFLEKETYENFLLFSHAAEENGIIMVVDSGYRPYEYQEKILEYNLAIKGLDAYKTVALPGHSEHQTGLALDYALIIDGNLCDDFDESFWQVKWILDNAYRFGFILRYPKGKENITGYNYECWHLRYVGSNVATIMHGMNIETLEEYHLRKKEIFSRKRSKTID